MTLGFTEEELIAMRQQLHQIPEIGLEEFKTNELLMKWISEMQTDYMEIRQWQTGIVVKIQGTNPEKTIGWRTDIDGLPITEEVISDYQSLHEGQMHACGHDFHMTIALGLLKNFSLQQPKNNFIILFQPAEENEAGGMLMYEAGVLADDFKPDEFYALHVAPELPVGTISTRTGTLFASTCEIQATFIGKGGHAAFPQLANDMIVAASQFVQQMQTIVSRSVDPIQGAVITLGTFNAGTTTNVIAGEAHLSGTIRTLTQEMNDLTQQRIAEVIKGIEISYNCKVEYTLDQKGYLPVVNDLEKTEKFMSFMEKQTDVDFREAQPAMTGEDFGYLLDKIPGTMFWLGVDSPYALHHPQFNPKEKALPFAVKQISKFMTFLDQA
ncbi:N-acetyldiaminopimelate deacetylase [Enterococcus sp. PF1-24]|uniref:N-acetyldiaminopimelate deacetylase n=1 Tax=unclassified Enterococcus TaxID=2608891 RepID=UPI002476485D|nr:MULTISPECIES: N-acetyldiaminopimelate deacetylase [unclassified Enterococcus]MDH6363028.1 N-acetyldiaminopimelate deacetylase [Enterococcus sp. PFB1-1]MDH6400122.1 N-acetyldiaminopimelate deacetylase [Enterococcus sp. PF1-24]